MEHHNSDPGSGHFFCLFLALIKAGLSRPMMLVIALFQLILLFGPINTVRLFPLVFLIILAVLSRWRIGQVAKAGSRA